MSANGWNSAPDFSTSRSCRSATGFETNVIRVANRAMVDAHVADAFGRLSRTQAAEKLACCQHRVRLRERCRRLLAPPRAATCEGCDAEWPDFHRSAAGSLFRRSAPARPGTGTGGALDGHSRGVLPLRPVSHPVGAVAGRRGRSAQPYTSPGRALGGPRLRQSAALSCAALVPAQVTAPASRA